MDTLTLMRAVTAVADAQSFTAAAAALRVTPQVISKQVKAFEDQLGVRIFDRTTRRVRLTPVGEAVTARCRRILDDYDELEDAVLDRQQRIKGRIRLTAPVSFGEMYVVPALNAFQAAHPEVCISLFLSDRFVNMIDEGVDAAVRIGRLEDSALVARKLAETQLICVASPAYIEANGAPTHPEHLRHHRVIHDDNLRGGPRWPFVVDGTGARFEVRFALSVNSATAVRSLAIAGAGIGMTPRFVVLDALSSGQLQEILPDFVNPPSPVSLLLLPHGRLLTGRIRALAEHLTAWLKDAVL